MILKILIVLQTVACQQIEQHRKMDKFIEIYDLLRLNQEEIDKLNRPIINSEVRFVI